MEKYIESYKKRIIDIIKEGMENGIFLSDINPEIIIGVVFTIHAALFEKLDFFEKFSPDVIFKNTVICYLRGISTPKGLELIEKTLTFENFNKIIKNEN
jgi:two-component SAPR family response regulator